MPTVRARVVQQAVRMMRSAVFGIDYLLECLSPRLLAINGNCNMVASTMLGPIRRMLQAQ